ncbi:hypothetical protein NXS98_12090 [Fontisphaera persica]|uniref:hypothetical protein n=1 Tax=Fontisphaera persica TaxID=2974023 RepID=UPI0024BF1F24|nr:hypothetical protein [Fontisphaera persica]WCJ58460.1 hypothetical protein NXS98_12090 [Fontisphaera persica]
MNLQRFVPTRGRAGAGLWLAATLAGASLVPAAQNVPAPSTNNPAATLEELARLDPALAKELERLKIRRWDLTVNVAVGAGYKDNVLLSHDSRQGSPFVRLGMEATVLRLPEKGWSFSGLAVWEDLRFSRHLAVDKEQTGMAVAEVKKTWAGGGSLALRGQYLYFDQVLDLSDEQGIAQPLPVRLHALQPRVIARQELGRNFFAEAEASGSFYEYQAPVDDYAETGPLVRLGYQYGHRSEVSLAYEYNHRWYDSRQVTDATGAPLAGTRLEYAQQRAFLTWRHHLDEQRRWRAALRLRLERSLDNGADFYGYWKYGVQSQLRYQHPRWSVLAGARWTLYDYPVQPVAPGTGELYQRAEVDLTLGGEVKLGKEVRFEWEYQWERNMSNLKFTEYQAHTVWAGIKWEF